jgi:hypothetical protein
MTQAFFEFADFAFGDPIASVTAKGDNRNLVFDQGSADVPIGTTQAIS